MSQNTSAVIFASGIDISAYLGNLVKYASRVFLLKLGNTNSWLDNVCWNNTCADIVVELCLVHNEDKSFEGVVLEGGLARHNFPYADLPAFIDPIKTNECGWRGRACDFNAPGVEAQVL